jgi:hypothetical protein
MLEVFSDISYGANADHRSIQGLLVCYAGVPMAWQCGAQPFVAHSTAEAELVAYCEALVVGKATEALLCVIWGEDIKSNTFDRVIYGDNAAAIGLAHGVTTSSWRTRHLRIRASVLKKALSDSEVNPGGRWKLLHLKGTELVADGLTKALLGQAILRFVEDLGLQRANDEGASSSTGDGTTSTGADHGGAALRALVIGSLLLSTAEARDEEVGDADFTPIWVTGAILMAMGAIYSGQLLYGASRCCLKRLRLSEGGEGLRLDTTVSEDESSGEETALMMSDDEDGGSSTSKRRGKGVSTSRKSVRQSGSSSAVRASSMSLTSRSSLVHQDGSGSSSSLRERTQSGSGSAARATSQRMTAQSGLHGAMSTTTQSLTSQSGLSSGEVSKRSHEAGRGSLSLTGRSGSCSASGGTSSLDPIPRSGFQLAAAGEPAEMSACAADGGSVGRAVEERRPHGLQISNPWNLFQHSHKNKGLTSTQLSKMYKDEKSPGAKMP